MQRKKMLALLIEDVTLDQRRTVSSHIRWRGGKTQSIAVDKPTPIALVRKTPAAGRAADRRAAGDVYRPRVARRLNELGHRNWRGQSFTFKKVPSSALPTI